MSVLRWLMFQSARTCDHQRHAHQDARVDPAGEPAGERHDQQRRNTAHRQRQAGVGRGVAQHLLQQLRDELGGAEEDHAGDHHQQELAIAKLRWRNSRRSTIGSLRVSSQGMMAMKRTPRRPRRR